MEELEEKWKICWNTERDLIILLRNLYLGILEYSQSCVVILVFIKVRK